MRARYVQKFALATWRNGDRHRFPVPAHHRIYTEGDDYVIGCYQTRCEAWRQPKAVIATLQLRTERPWLT